MKTHLAAAALAACFLPTASAQWSASTPVAPQFKPGVHKPVAYPTGGSTSSLVVGGSDDCSTAEAIAGPGPHAFTTATTGSQGQANASCLFFGQTGISNDVWFNWTAGASGTATLTICGTATFDTKVAVYGAAGCPAGAPLACNDDSCGLQSQLTFPAVNGTTYAIQVGLFPGAVGGSGTFSVTVAGGPGGNDDCASAAVIVGSGPHPFTTGTTGAQGQGNANCLFFGQTGVANDVWFQWTAPSTGNATVTTCSLATFDTKIAVYNGTGCPAGAAIACNDDACGLQTSLSFPATAGSTYTLQVGLFPGAAGGSGNFTINVSGAAGPCDALDDGVSTTSVGFTAGGSLAWMQRYGAASGSTTVSQILTAYGSPTGGAAQNPPNGTPVTAAIWDDPNDDGNPTDGVLLQTVAGVVTNTGTDIFATFNLAPALTINGFFFVGVAITHPAGQFPAPLDQPVNPSSNNAAWIVGHTTGGPVDLVNLAANSFPPTPLSGIAGLNGQWLLRVTCGGGGPPFAQSCVPGAAGVTACPCGNPPVGAVGCNNSAATGGASLAGSGSPSVGADTSVLTLSGALPGVLAIVVQGDALSNGVQFGQGILCASGNLLRIETTTTGGGGSVGTTIGIAARSAFLGDVLGAGSVRHYGAYYRDPTVLGGCPSNFTFNASSGVTVTWQP